MPRRSPSARARRRSVGAVRHAVRIVLLTLDEQWHRLLLTVLNHRDAAQTHPLQQLIDHERETTEREAAQWHDLVSRLRSDADQVEPPLS